MRAFWAILKLELQNNKMLLLAAFLVGWLPVLAPLIPGTERHAPEDIHAAVLAVALPIFATLLILGLGSSFLTRDLAEQRLSFYLARPVAGSSLWFAKLFGNFLLTVTAFSILCLPSIVVLSAFDRVRGSFDAQDLFWLWVALLLILVLLALVHALAVMVRARTAWLLFDLLAISLIVGLGWLAYDLILSHQLRFNSRTLPLLALLWSLAALVTAGCIQTAQGRNHLGRSHRLISSTLWPPILAMMLSLVFYLNWMTSPSKIEITHLLHLEAAPKGPWLTLGGQLRHRAPYLGAFLFNVETGTNVNVGPLDWNYHSLTFSGDGETAVRSRCPRLWKEPCELIQFDLTEAQPEAKPLSIEVRSPTTQLVLSEDGQRLAFWDEGNLAIYALPSTRLITALQIPKPEDLRFVSQDELWIRTVPFWQDDQLHMELKSFDLTTRKLTSFESFPLEKLPAFLTAPAGIRFEELIEIAVENQFETFFNAQSSSYSHRLFGRWLSDGRLLWVHEQEEAYQFSIFSASQSEPQKVFYPRDGKQTYFILGGEIEPGKLIVAFLDGPPLIEPSAPTKDPKRQFRAWKNFILDLETLEWIPFGNKVSPIPPPARHHAGSMAAQLFLEPDALVRLSLDDPEHPEKLLDFYKTSPLHSLYF